MKVVWKPNTASIKKRKGKLALFFETILSRTKKFLIWAFVIIPIFAVSLFFLLRYLSSGKFNINNVAFFGTTLTRQEDLEAIKTDFLGRNIFLLRTSEIELAMREKGTYVSEVYVEKILPDSLEVYIEEKIPQLIYINFSNAYLLTGDSEVVDVISKDQELGLSDEEISILKGFGDLNSNYVIERIISKQENLEDNSEKIEEFKKSITEEEKLKTLKEIRGEMQAKIEQIYGIHLDNVSKSRFWHLPVTFVYETMSYQLTDNIDNSKIKFFLNVVKFIDENKEFEVWRYQWDSKFRLSIHLVNGKIFYFSTKRDFNLQKEDLLIVLNELKTEDKNYRSIDVGADKVVVDR
ncbi:FtsQ-type POTRA domain-containing protein [Candidatus Dojkabacteria bacterium]|nr:FtsQ-type POTRA domain-containing protein [Candidatus Dojkabacteria bacterium]